jgi:predicted esterase YcpF (UPF0227 family)
LRTVLYLHGFRSSPASFKARRLQDHFSARGDAHRFLCPQLPPSPREAMALIRTLVRELPAAGFAVVGSSLGGFYATAVAEETGCRAVLINPAVWPARDLARYIGEQKAWHSDERFWFRAEYIAELEALTAQRITRPQRYLLLAATGDEVLDWREMTARYAGTHQHVIEGSDHGLSDFDDYLDEVVRFCEEK